MAKIKIRFDSSEIEIDSRDFYLDNQTIGSVIEDLSRHMSENEPKSTPKAPKDVPKARRGTATGLESLKEAEVYEPEFTEPRPIEPEEIKAKLQVLEDNRFFDSPRTVTETVAQLRESGWIASSLDVSKALAKMATSKEISKNLDEDHAYYFAQKALLTT